ncbi:alpha/beta hydrolase [bacterium]|nr:alpha/beta hydrolase [bacterium]
MPHHQSTAPAPGSANPQDSGPIASLETVTLGDQPQWILIRGQRRTNPVLLFIHGGPGATEMTAIREYLGRLEEDFVVVSWDQRGQGKSFAPGLAPETMTHAQILSDAHELILQLNQRFGSRQVVIVAHSWGTITGTMLAQRYPELVAAYVGVSQWTDGIERERASYALILDWAKKAGKRRAVRELEALGAPPYASLQEVGKQKSWLVKSGGMLFGQRGMSLFFGPLLRSKEYGLFDKLNFMRGFMVAMERLWPEAMEIDLTQRVPHLAVPVYFVSGRHDFNMPLPLVEAYFQQLQAPYKEHVVFEQSAHAACFEEPERFVSLMQRIKQACCAAAR